MKKWASLLCAAGLAMTMAGPAQAVEIKVGGIMEFLSQWDSGIDQSTDAAFQSYADTVYNGVKNGVGVHGKHYRANQRLILHGEFIISEDLSAVYDCIAGYITWGGPATGVTPYAQMNGGALGTRSNNIITRNAYLDWRVPHTRIRVRMGQQFFYLPGFATGSLPIRPEWGTGIVVNAPLTSTMSATGIWMRAVSGPRRGMHENFPITEHSDDTADFFALTLPIRGQGFRVAPVFGYGIVGKDSFGTRIMYGKRPGANGWMDDPRPGAFYLFPQGQWARNMGGHDFSATSDIAFMPVMSAAAAANIANGTRYQPGTVHPFWLGFGGEITLWDPLRLAWDFSYGATKTDHRMFDRSGYYVGLAASYKTRWGVPAIKAWWTTGDDSNIHNGSERPSAFASGGANTDLLNASGLNNLTLGYELGGLMGSWGFSLQWNNFSVLPNVFHSLRLAYFQGRNNPAMARYARMGLIRTNNSPGNVINYLTTKDRMVEVDWTNICSIYKNLAAMFEVAYIFTDFDKKVWGYATTGGEWRNARFSNAWRMALSLRYTF